MTLLTTMQTKQVHREVYIALLNSALQEPGSKQKFASQIGITQQYLSYLLHPDMDDSSTFRSPNIEIAEKIARSLPIDREQSESILNHMKLAHNSNAFAAQILRSERLPKSIEDFLKELREADKEANFTLDPQVSRMKYRVISEMCKLLLNYRTFHTYSLNVVEVSLLLHETQCILNRTDDALYHAKSARMIMNSLSRDDYRDKERFDSFQLQVWRAEARAYSDLRLYQEAYKKCFQAEKSDVMRYQSDDCIAQLYRDKLQALCRTTRFTLSEAEGLVAKVRAICDRTNNDLAPRWLFMTNQYMARAYLNHHNLKKAKKLLTEMLGQITSIPHLGPLHQTMFLKTYARFRWEEGDHSEWEYFLKRALTYAVDAGLAHQISDIKRTYGLAIIPLMKEVVPT